MTNNFHDLTTRNLFISLCSHMSYMQGQLEALHQLDDPDDHYWFRESVALRQKVADHLTALADEPAVPQGGEPAAVTGQLSDGEVAELVETLKGIAYWRRHGKPGEPAPTSFDIRQADRLDRAAELLERLSPPQPVPVSERLPGPSVKVLAHYFNGLGKGRTICAIWVPAKTRSDSYGDDDFTEYDEESDTFYWPEGWYETIENWDDLGYVKVVEGEVIYWQPIPKWPAHALPVAEVGE